MKKTLIIAWIATLALAGSMWGLVNAQSTTNIWGKIKVFSNHFWTGGTGNMMRGIKDQVKWLKNQIKITKEQMIAIKTAVKNNNYNAFVTANGTGHNPWTGEFEKMVTNYTKKQAINTAITNNDYNAFVTARTPNKEEFAKMVERNKMKTAINTAITNKDYNAFLTAIKGDTNRPTNDKTITKEEFNILVANSTDMQNNMGMWDDHKRKGDQKWDFDADRPESK